jgi:hypothetical protein
LRLLACLLAVPLAVAILLFEHVSLTRQRLQYAVDLAAETGAAALAQRADVRLRVRGQLARKGRLRAGDRLEIEYPPAGGRLRGWKGAVRVRVQSEWRAPLLPRSAGARLPLDVRATVVAVPGPGGRFSLLRAE